MAKRKAERTLQKEQTKQHKPAADAHPQHEEQEHKKHGPKRKVLVLSTRGITFRQRHLMMDLVQLLPHSKKDTKLDTKNDRAVINEVADLKDCSSVVFFEARRHQDLYMWLGKAPAGPCYKFLVQNIHTMAELKLTGNHLKGSRPILSFDKAFDEQPHLQLLKELLTQMFATPRRHHKAKPFFDHVITFTVADGRIWFRNYQVVIPLDKKKPDAVNSSLVEVGPRFAMQPVHILQGKSQHYMCAIPFRQAGLLACSWLLWVRNKHKSIHESYQHAVHQ